MFQRIFLISLLLLTLLSACQSPMTGSPAATPTTVLDQSSAADLDSIKTYLLNKTVELKTNAAALQTASGGYYDLAKAADFDYAALWTNNPSEVAQVLTDAKSAWMKASPVYEEMEGIVAGVPSLSTFDVILDAGSSAAEDPDNAAPYDLTLPDGRTLEKPGNLFGVLESTLWGTEPTFKITDADLDGNGSVDFGEVLPDANVLKAASDTLVTYSTDLENAATLWSPLESDAFTALVVMIPTMNEYFNSWKASRFISGDASSQRDFVAISRLADIQDILGSLQVVYDGVEPLAATVSPDQATQIEQSLADLKAFVADIHNQEKNGRRFSAEEADILGNEAQNRATALAGQISQIAAQLLIPIAE